MLAGLELHHHGGELVFRHLTVADRDARLGDKAVHALRCLLDRAYSIVHEIDLASPLQLAPHRLLDQLVIVRGHVGLDRLSFFGRSLDHAHVADAADRHVQRARDGRRRQREHIELGAELFQALLLHDTEPMLFVDDKQPKALEPDVALEQAMRADHDVDVPGLQAFDRPLLRLVIDEARQHLDHNREVLQTLAENVEVLLRQHRGRRQHRDLLAAHRRFESRA